MGMWTFGPKLYGTFRLAAVGGSKATGLPPLSVLPMTCLLSRLGDSHPRAVTSRLLSSNASKDVPLLSGAGHSMYLALSVSTADTQ